MEREEPTAEAAASLYEGGGAGGKFRRRPFRRPPATPYDRPPKPQPSATGQKRDGWFSKVASGAARFIPSFLSKTLADPSPLPDQQTTQAGRFEVSNNISNNQTSESKDIRGSIDEDGPKGGSGNDEFAGDKSVDDSGLSSIEQLVKQKTFSRDEFNRLMRVLRSRTLDTSDVVVHGNESTNVDVGTEAVEKDIRKSVEEKQAGQLGNGVLGRVLNPPIQSDIYNEVGTSPVEIAKAFMGSRTSALSLDSLSPPLKNKQVAPCNNDFASSSILPSVLKSPTCWPGAMVQDVPGHLIPRTQTERGEIHNFPRSPYQHAIHSRSISKGISERSVNLPSTRMRQPYTPVLGGSQVMKRKSVLDGGFATVGPIRRIRWQPMETPFSRGASSSHTAGSGLLQSSTSDAVTGPTAWENTESGTSITRTKKFHHIDNKTPTYGIRSSTVHPHSNEMARRILEHLDRTVPSPKEKAAELKLVAAKNKPPEITSEMLSGQPSQFDVGHDSQRSSCVLVRELCSYENGDRRKDTIHNQVGHNKVDEAAGSRSKHISTSTMFSFTDKLSAKLPESKISDKLLPLQHPTSEKGYSDLAAAARPASLPMQNHQAHSSGSQLSLSSFLVTKPNGKHATSTDSGSGFTFPVSGAFAALNELPTPTIIPSFASRLPQQVEGSTTPSFSFGSSSSAQGPVFTFNPIASTSIVDTSIPKFSFGSDKKNSISFRPVGKDSICY